METQITNPVTFVISCLASGLLSGLIGGVCCCLPFFSGIGALSLYQYIERRPLSFVFAVLAALLSGLIASVPASLLNLLAWFYVDQNKELLSAELKPLLQEMGTQPSFGITLLSFALLFAVLSLVGTLLSLVFRSATTAN